LVEDIDWRSLVYIENHHYELPGIRIEALPSREYIHGNLLSHTIGYLGHINKKELLRHRGENYEVDDQIGKIGLEKIYEKELRGEKGRRYVEIDAQGFEQKELSRQEPLPGDDIQLTIDMDLQEIAEKALAGRAGAVTVLAVNSGEVLALASSPPLDLNAFIGGISTKEWNKMRDNPLKPFYNKAIQGVYPPGSTYKIVTAMAGLTEGVITPQTLIYCNGYMKLHGQRYNCWKRGGHGAVNLHKALAQSCDVYFYQVGLKLGVDKLARYAKSLGLGAKTGLELEGEKGGLVPTSQWKRRKKKEIWQEGETMSLAIGQGFNLTTPLQVCLMTATLSNGGTLYKPQIVKEIRSSSGKVLRHFSKVVRGKALGNASSYGIIRDGLVAAVNAKHGTGGRARLEDIVVGGKTGTAQVVRLAKYRHIPDKEIPYKWRDHAWFTCFAPADKPEIAVTVMVEHGRHGGSGAAPIAKLVLDAYFAKVKHAGD